jgi:hypothetical protein
MSFLGIGILMDGAALCCGSQFEGLVVLQPGTSCMLGCVAAMRVGTIWKGHIQIRRLHTLLMLACDLFYRHVFSHGQPCPHCAHP